MISSPALLGLLQLASPSLPVGAYCYSQGLEAAIEAGVVRDAASARAWIDDVLRFGMSRLEAPLWLRLYRSWQRDDLEGLRRWNAWFVASRETTELRAETLQMGYSLARLWNSLGEASGLPGAALIELQRIDEVSFPTAFTAAAVAWRIPETEGLLAYLWSWLENQVLAAVKAVPLGQTDGQRLLLELGARLPELAAHSATLVDDDLCNFTPGLAIASSQHESQYSRLFRS